jgi:RNA polymerase sigma-70 factor (ECF subfamily)
MSRHKKQSGASVSSAADEEAVRAILAGDVDRYAELVGRYRDRYARYAASVLGSIDAAEDAVQDAFVRAFDQLAQCRDPANFSGWFFLILRNRCLAERRSEKEMSGLDDPRVRIVSNGEAASDEVEQRERVFTLQRALMELTLEQREIFALRHVEGWSYEDIAAKTGVTVAALKMRMHRAYEGLRQRLGSLWTPE